MDDKVARYFGYVIAFLAPGFLGLWAVSYYSAAVAAWLGRASGASTSVGDFLFVVVASVGVGVFLSGVRFFVFEGLLFKLPLPFLKVAPRVADDDEARRLEPAHRQAVHEDIREQHYRYYQFYANTAVALLLVFVAWWPKGWIEGVPKWAVAIAFFVAEVVLVASARDALDKFRRKKAALLRIIVPPSSAEEGSNDDQRRRHPEGPAAPPPEAGTAPAQANTGTTAPAAAKADAEKGLTGPER